MQFKTGTPRHKNAGRKAGTPNKVTSEVREIVHSLVSESTSKLDIWLERVAEKDPARALEIFLKMTEYVLPKLSRRVHIDETAPEDRSITVRFVKAEDGEDGKK